MAKHFNRSQWWPNSVHMHAPSGMKYISLEWYYRKVSNIRPHLSNKIVDHLDEVGASPVGAAPTSSSLST